MRISAKYRLICFDEFHISDIADAMILYRLLLRLFEYDISFVMTSNYEPSMLYPNGLHRDRIFPAINLIETRMEILNVDAGIDYRRRSLAEVEVYLYPLSQPTQAILQKAFERLADTAPQEPVLIVKNRQLRALALAGRVVWFNFTTLCGGLHSQNDYLELANRFYAVILSEVPKLSVQQSSEARRFMWLVDVFYDHKVKLVVSAECPPDELYLEGPFSSEFHRTVSRLLEMQSKQYLDTEQRSEVLL